MVNVGKFTSPMDGMGKILLKEKYMIIFKLTQD